MNKGRQVKHHYKAVRKREEGKISKKGLRMRLVVCVLIRKKRSKPKEDNDKMGKKDVKKRKEKHGMIEWNTWERGTGQGQKFYDRMGANKKNGGECEGTRASPQHT